MLILSDKYDFIAPDLISSKISQYIKYEIIDNKVVVTQLNTNVFRQFNNNSNEIEVKYQNDEVLLSEYANLFYDNKEERIGDACLLDLILQNRERTNKIELDREKIKLNLLFVYMLISSEEKCTNQMINYTKRFIILLRKNSKLIYDLGW